jgi:hypothetical protein
MPVFKDSENQKPFVPPGDYIFRVVDFEIGISTSQKTNGSEKYELEVELEGQGKKVQTLLIDHESCAWKLDTFLKSAGVQLRRGEAYDFRKDRAEATGVRWVNPIGLRGWCKVGTKPGLKDPSKTFNEIEVFYTDREKLHPVVEVPEEDQPF